MGISVFQYRVRPSNFLSCPWYRTIDAKYYDLFYLYKKHESARIFQVTVITKGFKLGFYEEKYQQSVLPYLAVRRDA
jgi:hypothetical protein